MRTTAYNAASQVTQKNSAEGRPAFYGYDGAGRLTSVTQRSTPATPATAIAVSLGYDGNGNQTRILDSNGNATTYTYNPWNLAESAIEPSTTAHPAGRIMSATSPAGNHTYTWTDRGGLATATGYGGTATYTYDSDRRLTGRTDGAGGATFGYDGADRVTSIVDPLTATTATNTYDAAGRLGTVTHGAAKSTRDYTYDNLGRLATDTTRKPDTTTAASITYGYDTDGLLTSKTSGTLPLGYQGGWTDYEAALVNARWYDPASGAWTTVSRIGFQ